VSGGERLEREERERWPLQRANLLERVLGWEREAEEALREAGKLVPANRHARTDADRERRREILLAEAGKLRAAAADVRLILDVPRPSPLRDPLARW